MAKKIFNSEDFIELYSNLFVNYCDRRVGGITLEFLTNCIVEKFDSMDNFFECCAPYFYIYDAIGLENADKSSPRYIYWNEFNKAWRAYIETIGFPVNKNKNGATPDKKDSGCESIW